MALFFNKILLYGIFIVVYINAINGSNMNMIEKIEFIHDSNKFATKLYSKLLEENLNKIQKDINGNNLNSLNTNGNNNNNISFVFSPFSIHSCFSMLYAGSRGIVAEELENTFNLGHHGKLFVSENFKDVYDTYKRSQIMKIANQIVINNNVELRPEYQDIIKENFHSQVKLLDFNKPYDAADNINYWISQKTDGKINKLIKGDNLTPDTRLIMISVIYLKGVWLHPFDKCNTIKKPFWLSETETKRIDIMNTVQNLKYRKMPSLKSIIVELPYANSNLSMVLFVPRERNGLKQIEKNINELNLLEWSRDMKKGLIDLYMPKFKIETEIDLSEPLKKMGLQAIFNGGDFSDLAKYTGPIQLSKATHKAIIEVNEKGTEASAATDTEITTRSGPIRVNADHPFLFMIKDVSGHTFFMGRMNG